MQPANLTLQLLTVWAAFALIPAAVAAQPEAAGRRLAATCAACHGTDGVTVGNTLPSLAGQPQQALIDSLKAFKAGTRPATIMHQLARGYSDEQLEALAVFFSAQKK